MESGDPDPGGRIVRVKALISGPRADGSQHPPFGSTVLLDSCSNIHIITLRLLTTHKLRYEPQPFKEQIITIAHRVPVVGLATMDVQIGDLPPRTITFRVIESETLTCPIIGCDIAIPIIQQQSSLRDPDFSPVAPPVAQPVTPAPSVPAPALPSALPSSERVPLALDPVPSLPDVGPTAPSLPVGTPAPAAPAPVLAPSPPPDAASPPPSGPTTRSSGGGAHPPPAASRSAPRPSPSARDAPSRGGGTQQGASSRMATRSSTLAGPGKRGPGPQ